MGFGSSPRLAPLPSSERFGLRARADRVMGSVFPTALEQGPVQGFAGRWLKVMHYAGRETLQL